jgi:adenylate kinase family enzyme
MESVGQRIVVLGITGSGKSTLARELSNIYGFNYIELDNLFWKPNWEMTDDDEFLGKVTSALADNDSWVVDGNYTRVGSTLIWQQTDTFIWLDYPLRVNFWRIFKRTWARFLTQEPMWDAGNKETLWKHFLTKESLFVWAWQSYPKKKMLYNEMFASPEFSHCHKIHLQTPQETNHWLKTVKNGSH